LEVSFGWHPRAHRAALEGMLSLSLEERGAYNTLLDLIYDRGAPVPDDVRWLAGWMGVSLKRWSSIRASLVVKGKIYALNYNGVDCLMNERAAIEIESQLKLSRNAAEIGAKGGRKRSENASALKENNEITQAPAQAEVKLKTKTQTEETPVSPNGLTAPEGAACGPDKIASDFELFWTVYPRKTAKDAARKVFSRALKRTTMETILLALERQREWEQWRRGIIPHPATWLNNSRWNDEDPPSQIRACNDERANSGPNHPTAPGRAARRGVWAEVLAEERGATTGFGD
jgi:uncharacterized protein YdaU (DUF1376 family)